jgi:hypothetical protein
MLHPVQPHGLLATLAAAALAGVLGCGEEDRAATDYRRQANAICAQAERRIEALPAPATPDGLERYLRRGLAIAKRYDRRLRALEAPAELRAEHLRAGRLSRRGEVLLESLLDDLGAGLPSPETLGRKLPKLERTVRESNALAERMGLDECVTPLTLPGESPEPS